MSEEDKTLVAVLASHDSVMKNNELAALFEILYKEDKVLLGSFHFLFSGGTFQRIILGIDTEVPARSNLKPVSTAVKQFICKRSTILPDRKQGGITILSNLIVQRQCSIVWTFLSPITVHWLGPENLAMLRLCDYWKIKQLMNAESVRAWFRDEAQRDIRHNPQSIGLTMALGTTEQDGKWPQAERNSNNVWEIRIPRREERNRDYWSKFEELTIALIAHDEMKTRMVDFAIEYEKELLQFKRILATGTTGQEVINACRKLRENDKVRRCLSGPKGGDIEIATEILLGRCNIIIFFIDPLHPHAHIDDIRVVISACMAEIENNDVRMLTNEVSAREWIEEAVRRV